MNLSKIWIFLRLYSKLTTTYEKVSNLRCCVQTPADRSAGHLQNFNLWQVCDVMYSCFLWCEAPPSFTDSLESWQQPSEFICPALLWCQLQEIFLLQIFWGNSNNRLRLKSEKIWEQIGFENWIKCWGTSQEMLATSGDKSSQTLWLWVWIGPTDKTFACNIAPKTAKW